MDLETFNSMEPQAARDVLMQCCAATRWVAAVSAARPFATIHALQDAAFNSWLEMRKPDWLEAFAAHPKIGDINSLAERFANTRALASGEQSNVTGASAETLQALAQGNHDYEEKFGFIFIVFATGKSADDILALLQKRLTHSRDQELAIAASEQHKITTLRLQKLFAKPRGVQS